MESEQDKELIARRAAPNLPHKPNYALISLQKVFVTILVLIGVAIVVYIMPMPEEYFLECDRECHELDWPMICRIKLTVEVYKTMSRACGNCSTIGGRSCRSPHCISADGRERGVLVANRMLPAQKIHVCQNDILVIDVVNRAPSHSLAFHWRGQPQKETPFMDGAPMLTQCPAPSFTTFQYKFRASETGTHMYHAHSGSDAADGLAGALIVRLPPRLETLRKYYDEDLSHHVIVISEWGKSLGVQNDFEQQSADSILVNGMGKGSSNTPHAVFQVKKGKRYRFRIAYSGGVRDCPVTFNFEKHDLKIIALDGKPIVPMDVNRLEFGRGERVDIVINAQESVNSYKIFVNATSNCQENLYGLAQLQYEGDNSIESSVNSDNLSDTLFSTKDLRGVKSAKKLPVELSKDLMEETIIVPFFYEERQRSSKRIEGWGTSDGYRFAYPASPLLTQAWDTPSDDFCPPKHGDGKECVNVKSISLGASVELVMHNQGSELEQIFHLHGYTFYVVGVRIFDEAQSLETLQTLHQKKQLFDQINLIDPVEKDTIMIPKYGVVALRFKAENPGFWLMRDEKSAHWTRGLDFVLKVGENYDFVKAPADFPKCGSYIGPEYFLI